MIAGTERLRALRRQQAAWVLDVDRIDAEADQFARLSRIIVVSVNGADRVDDAASRIEPYLLRGAHRNLHIAHIIERVVRRVIADAVGEDALGGQLDNVIRKKLEGEEALTAGHHDERGIRDPAAENPHALPWVLAQIPHADVEHRATGEIDGFESCSVQSWRDLGHHRRRHARRPKALMGVAHRHVDELDPAALVH